MKRINKKLLKRTATVTMVLLLTFSMTVNAFAEIDDLNTDPVPVGENNNSFLDDYGLLQFKNETIPEEVKNDEVKTEEEKTEEGKKEENIEEEKVEETNPEEEKIEGTNPEEEKIEGTEPEDVKPEEKITEEEKADFYSFSQEDVVDGVRISVSAPEGVFPENAYMVARKVSEGLEQEIGQAVADAMEAPENVEESYTFDISIYNAEDEEIEPNTEYGEVTVTFSLDASVADDSCQMEVFHVDDDMNAENLSENASASVEDDRLVISASTDGFSFYVITFKKMNVETVEKEYVFCGDKMLLTDLLSELEISGDVEGTPTSDNTYKILITEEEGKYILNARSSSGSANLSVTVGGTSYSIRVSLGQANIQYRFKKQGTDNWSEWSSSVPEATDAGTYVIEYKQTNDNYDFDPEVVTLTATIAPENLSDTTRIEAEYDALTFAYDGTTRTVNVTLKDNSDKLTNHTLEEGKDYTISGNSAATGATHELVITGIGNYTGTIRQSWTITGIPSENPPVEPSEPSEPSEPEPTIEPVKEKTYTAPENIGTGGAGETTYNGPYIASTEGSKGNLGNHNVAKAPFKESCAEIAGWSLIKYDIAVKSIVDKKTKTNSIGDNYTVVMNGATRVDNEVIKTLNDGKVKNLTLEMENGASYVLPTSVISEKALPTLPTGAKADFYLDITCNTTKDVNNGVLDTQFIPYSVIKEIGGDENSRMIAVRTNNVDLNSRAFITLKQKDSNKKTVKVYIYNGMTNQTVFYSQIEYYNGQVSLPVVIGNLNLLAVEE